MCGGGGEKRAPRKVLGKPCIQGVSGPVMEQKDHSGKYVQHHKSRVREGHNSELYIVKQCHWRSRGLCREGARGW